MTKTILILAIAAAFVAGSITTTAIPMAEAADKSHQDILNAINNGVNSILNAITGAKNEIKTDTAAIQAKTNALPDDPASNTQVNTRATQTSVDNLQATVDEIKTDVDSVLNKVQTDQTLLTWQYSGVFGSNARPVVLKQNAYSGVASINWKNIPDADGDGDNLDCTLLSTGVKADTDNNGVADTDVVFFISQSGAGGAGGFIPAGTDQLFVSANTVSGNADCFVEISLLIQEQK